MPTLVGVVLIGGCVSSQTPMNHSAELYDREKSSLNAHVRPHKRLSYAQKACPKAGAANYIMPGKAARGGYRKTRRSPMRYSPGDRFNLLILESPEFSGDYAINADGSVILPFAGQISAIGLTNAQLTNRIQTTLVRRGIFSKIGSQVSVRPVQYAPVNVTVAGAVFSPGRHLINNVKEINKLVKIRTSSGDNPVDRFVPAALVSAGGVRPDADLSNIQVVRDGKAIKLNWRGAITGEPVDDLPLIEGDHVQVGEADCFQSALVRPTQITPAGIRVFYSNLTSPALGNASSIRSQRTSDGVPYGSRMLQGLIHANCVGGSYATNARRYGVLISNNPKTGKTEVVQRSVEQLVRSANRDAINPFLMPNDSIACYDSAVTEFRDVMSVIWGSALPAKSLSGL